MKGEDWWRDKDRRRSNQDENEEQGYEIFASTDM